MDNPYDETQPSLSSSNENCAEHTVSWEGSISGQVTLKPSASSLPVQGVVITWALMDHQFNQTLVNGSTTTSGSGSFQIAVNEVLNLLNDVDYPIVINFAKQTTSGNTTIDHTFLCNSGTINCTSNGTIVYLRHLDFNVPVTAYDATGIPFSGKVVVGSTGGPDSGDGCPIIGAKVCLVDQSGMSAGTGSVCGTTDSFGEYSIPAILGSRVGVRISYYNHTFQPIDQDSAALYDSGVLIEAGGLYQNNDFEDITQADLYVEVAGGLCDLTMGVSTIMVKVSGGCQWSTTLTQVSEKSAL